MKHQQQQLLDFLKKKLEELKQSRSDVLSEGVMKDFGEYQNLCGVIQGLSLAQREIMDLVRNLKEAEDD
jgi:hypothetical protein